MVFSVKYRCGGRVPGKPWLTALYLGQVVACTTWSDVYGPGDYAWTVSRIFTRNPTAPHIQDLGDASACVIVCPD